jgi:hypothetical protein
MIYPSPIADHAAWTLAYRDLLKKKTNLSTQIEKREKDLSILEKLREEQLVPLELRIVEMRNSLKKSVEDLKSEKLDVEKKISNKTNQKEHQEVTKTKKSVAEELVRLGQSGRSWKGTEPIQHLGKRTKFYS